MESEDRDHLRNVLIDAGHVLYTARYFASTKWGPTALLVQGIDEIRDRVEELVDAADPELPDLPGPWSVERPCVVCGDVFAIWPDAVRPVCPGCRYAAIRAAMPYP